MGYKRQQSRSARHESGDFAEKEQDYSKYRDEKAKPFNLRVFYRVPESDCLQKSKYIQWTSMRYIVEYFIAGHPTARILCVKKSPCDRWKPLENVSRKTIRHYRRQLKSAKKHPRK